MIKWIFCLAASLPLALFSVCAPASAAVAAANAAPAVIAAGANASPALAPRQLTPAETGADIAVLRQALEQTHPGLYRYAGKAAIAAAFTRLEKSAAEPMSELDFYRELSLFVATIRCDHTKVEYSDAMTRMRRERPTHLPLRFKLFDGRMYVAASDPAQPPLQRGTEVLSINGVPVERILGALRPAISIDGYTEASREAKLEADSDLMGSDFEQFYPAFFGWSERFELRLRAPHNGPVMVVGMKAINFRDWVKLPWTAASHRGEFYKSVKFALLDRHRALLQIDTFVNYRNPVAAALFYDAFFATLRDNKVEKLIIDLRENGGGSNDATLALAAHLLPRPFVWNKPILQKAIRFGDWTRLVETWGDPQQWFMAPAANFVSRDDGWFEQRPGAGQPETSPIASADLRFDGKVVVLGGPANASGATMLLAKLKDEQRVTLIGQPTGGSAEGPTAGRLFLLTLPASGFKVRIPVYWNRMNIAGFESGLGVRPDLSVVPTLEDWLSGRDRAMEAALAAD